MGGNILYLRSEKLHPPQLPVPGHILNISTVSIRFPGFRNWEPETSSVPSDRVLLCPPPPPTRPMAGEFSLGVTLASCFLLQFFEFFFSVGLLWKPFLFKVLFYCVWYWWHLWHQWTFIFRYLFVSWEYDFFNFSTLSGKSCARVCLCAGECKELKGGKEELQ